MQFWISHFYNVRHFPAYMVPVSTAIWDPKWYHDGKGDNYIFIDKNGIVNGIKCLALNPSKIPQSCSKDCKQNPSDCTFKRDYLAYLRTLDFEYTLARIENSVKKLPGIGDICLLVHEAPSNPCGERECLKEWFLENDYYLKEWTP